MLTDFTRRESYDFVLRRMNSDDNPQHPIPQQLLLLRPDPLDPSAGQLFLDRLPIPRDAWRFDAHDLVLTWRGAFGGGHLNFSHDGNSAVGNIGSATHPSSVLAGASVRFVCAMALDCGATRVSSSGGVVVGFAWDPTSPAWQNASWVEDRLQLTYTVVPGGPTSPPSFTFDFVDLETEASPWDPDPGQFVAAQVLGSSGGQDVWNLTFKFFGAPPSDDGTSPSTGPDTVYPFWMQAVEDMAAENINGVMEIDDPSTGPLAGMQGTRSNNSAAGYYQISSDFAPVGVFDGRLTIAGRAVGRSSIRGSVLRWSDLDTELQARTGLPRSGSVRFNADGSRAVSDDGRTRLRQLGATAAIAAIARHGDLDPDLEQGSQALASKDDQTP